MSRRTLNTKFTAGNSLPICLQKSQETHSWFSTSSTLFFSDACWQFLQTIQIQVKQYINWIAWYCLALDTNTTAKFGFPQSLLQEYWCKWIWFNNFINKVQASNLERNLFQAVHPNRVNVGSEFGFGSTADMRYFSPLTYCY